RIDGEIEQMRFARPDGGNVVTDEPVTGLQAAAEVPRAQAVGKNAAAPATGIGARLDGTDAVDIHRQQDPDDRLGGAHDRIHVSTLPATTGDAVASASFKSSQT